MLPTYAGRLLNYIIIVAEKQHRIWQPKTHFFIYDGVYPIRGQQGLAIIAEFQLDLDRNGVLTLVSVPDPKNLSGNHINITGQFEFS